MSQKSSIQMQIGSVDTISIGVVGLGYTGLPLVHGFSEAGFEVTGYDIDEQKISRLQNEGWRPEDGTRLRNSGITYTSSPNPLADCGVIFVSVPTPVTSQGEPDTVALKNAGRTIGAHISEDTIVVLQSTIYPGGTREVFVPAIEAASEWTVGNGFHVGYAPERLSPGEEGHGLGDVAKILATPESDVRETLVDLFEEVIDATVHPLESIEAAEAAKCLENVQRDVNIALMNEFVMACDDIDEIDPYQVIEAAATKWNFHSYQPGLVDGHCIPVDPNYIIHRFEQSGFSPELMETARQVNDRMGRFVAGLVSETFDSRPSAEDNATNASLQSRGRILALGLTYKPDAEDVRSPTTKHSIATLRESGFDVVGYDPHALRVDLETEFDIPIQDTLNPEGFDALVIFTPHQQLRHLDLPWMAKEMDTDPILIDPFRSLDPATARDNGFIYRRL